MRLRLGLMRILVAAGATLLSGACQAADLVETGAKIPLLMPWTALLNASGLADTLKGPGPFTIFAPTEDGFRKLPQGTVDALFRPENRERLRRLVAYHIVRGRLTTAGFKDKETDPVTLEGSPVIVDGIGQAVLVNDATIYKGDIPADNGVLHEIDTVLLPPEK